MPIQKNLVLHLFHCQSLGFNNYKFVSIGGDNNTLLQIYGPGDHVAIQKNLKSHWNPNFILTFSLPPTDSGIVVNEGVVFNWQKRQIVFCGGQQVRGHSNNT